MFIIARPVLCASAKVRALSVSASSWLCSAMTPAPQQFARSRVTSSIPSRSATFGLEVEVELLAVLLGVRVDPLDVVLRVAGQLRVHPRDQLPQGAHLNGPDA